MFILLFLCTVFSLKLVYNEKIFNIFFACVAAYTAQHMAYALYCLFLYILGFSHNDVNGLYTDENVANFFSVRKSYVYVICYYVAYWLCWLVFGRRDASRNRLILGKTLFYLSAIIILIDVVLNTLVVYNVSPESGNIVFVIIYLFTVISCILALFIQFIMADRFMIANENEIIKQLLAQEQKQHELSKQSIDIINVKCHDLKHFINSFNGRIDTDEIQKLEKAISIYDSNIKTDNDVLDLILTEKSLLCEKNSIHLDCMVDGKQLDFISQSDLYSLFGNALDNAVEAVSKVEDIEKRVIGIYSNRQNNLISIHIENYFNGEVKFLDDKPVTSKEDSNYHGFGIKSMEMIAEKYGGYLNIRIDGDKFFLNIILINS